MKSDLPLMRREELTVLLIDIQPMFWDAMADPAPGLAERLRHLLMLAAAWEMPTIATLEQPVARKGSLVDFLLPVFPSDGRIREKNTFDCCAESGIVELLTDGSGRQVALAGAETDVCVLQSALGLRRLGFDVFLIEDCVFSSAHDTAAALRRMYQAGVIPVTWKSMAYELAGAVDAAPWLPESQDRESQDRESQDRESQDRGGRLPDAFRAPENI